MTTRIESRFLPDPKTVAIVGCPFRRAFNLRGYKTSNKHTPNISYIARLQGRPELGWDVKFDGHLQFEEIDALSDPPIGKLKNPRFVSSVCKAVAQAVGEHEKQGRLPVTLGGDHSLAMGTTSGTLKKYPDACVIYLGARADVNTAEMTGSGNIRDMPLSFVLDFGPAVDEFAWLQLPPKLKPHGLAYIGLREVDASERRIL